MVNHELKIEHKWLVRLTRGDKTCEVRRHDRDYQVGDHLILSCTDTSCVSHEYVAWITHVLSHETFPEGIQAGYCVLSFGTWRGAS